MSSLQSATTVAAGLDGLIGKSSSMQEIFRLMTLSAPNDAPVLLLGEIGTGKSRIAKTIHRISHRAAGPWVVVDCGAMTEEQLEGELFGKGLKAGRIEEANEGSLYLEEVHELSPRLQSRLLGFLQEGSFHRPGAAQRIVSRARLIASSNRDLKLEVVEGRFREDLFWQLSVLPLMIPPLRRRENDVELLTSHFVGFYVEKHSKQFAKVEPEAMKALVQYSWPGNVRELQNYIERAVIWTESDRITVESLPQSVVGDAKAAQTAVFRPTDEQSLIRELVFSRICKADQDAEDLYKQIVEPVERELLLQIMEACQQTQTRAAGRLGINRNTLYKKLVEFGLAKSNPSNE